MLSIGHRTRLFDTTATRDGVAAELDHAVVECGDRAMDVSAETSARLSCDAAVVVVRSDAFGSTVDVGPQDSHVPSPIPAHSRQETPAATSRAALRGAATRTTW
jgi:hypothetical protein